MKFFFKEILTVVKPNGEEEEKPVDGEYDFKNWELAYSHTESLFMQNLSTWSLSDITYQNKKRKLVIKNYKGKIIYQLWKA